MELKKRDCGIKMRLVPYGGGWTDVYADFGDGEIYFIISYLGSNSFETLMKALYHLYQENPDPEEAYDLVECKEGICQQIDGEYVVTKIVDRTSSEDLPCVVQDIPWKASFDWYEEIDGSKWIIERQPTTDTAFNVHVHIEIHRSEVKEYDYTVKYEDLCYAVADACTKALKKHGFWGYHKATYDQDMNIRYLLFLKSIALNNMEARELTYYDEKGEGETADFNKELELLLFDM